MWSQSTSLVRGSSRRIVSMRRLRSTLEYQHDQPSFCSLDSWLLLLATKKPMRQRRSGASRLEPSFHINEDGVQLQGPLSDLTGGTAAARRSRGTLPRDLRAAFHNVDASTR